MSREVFIQYKPQAATLAVIDQANVIIDEYQTQGFALSLRQLFYQFVSRALLAASVHRGSKCCALREEWRKMPGRTTCDGWFCRI